MRGHGSNQEIVEAVLRSHGKILEVDFSGMLDTVCLAV